VSIKPRQVDLGPLYLPVGEQMGFPAPAPQMSTAAARFEELMERAKQPSQVEHDGDGAARDADEGREADGDLPAQVERLWRTEHSIMRREVRVGVRNAVLPGMALMMYEEQDELRVEICCGADARTNRLVPRVPSLVRDLASRLRRRVRVSVFESDGTRSAEAAA